MHEPSTVGSVRDNSSFLTRFVHNHPSYFRSNNREPINSYVAKAREVMQYIIYTAILGAGYVAIGAAPAGLTPAVFLGVGLGIAGFATMQYVNLQNLSLRSDETLTQLYLKGVSLLKKRWQTLEALTWTGMATTLLGVSYYAAQVHPLGVGLFYAGLLTSAATYGLLYWGPKGIKCIKCFAGQ